MVEIAPVPSSKYDTKTRDSHKEINAAYRAIYDRLISEGETNIYFVTSDGLTGPEEEGTVDGNHLTDYGFRAYADKLHREIMNALDDLLPAGELSSSTILPSKSQENPQNSKSEEKKRNRRAK